MGLPLVTGFSLGQGLSVCAPAQRRGSARVPQEGNCIARAVTHKTCTEEYVPIMTKPPPAVYLAPTANATIVELHFGTRLLQLKIEKAQILTATKKCAQDN